MDKNRVSIIWHLLAQCALQNRNLSVIILVGMVLFFFWNSNLNVLSPGTSNVQRMKYAPPTTNCDENHSLRATFHNSEGILQPIHPRGKERLLEDIRVKKTYVILVNTIILLGGLVYRDERTGVGLLCGLHMLPNILANSQPNLGCLFPHTRGKPNLRFGVGWTIARSPKPLLEASESGIGLVCACFL